MSSTVARLGIISNLLKMNKNIGNFRRVYSSDVVAGAPKKESIMYSQSVVEDLTAAGPEIADRKFLYYEYGLVGAFTIALAGLGYMSYLDHVSHVSSMNEIKEKRKAQQEWLKHNRPDDGFVVGDDEPLLPPTNSPWKCISPFTGREKKHIMKMFENTQKPPLGPVSQKLLPDLLPAEQHVLDLDETLLHSDWKYLYPLSEVLDKNHYRGATKYQDGKKYRDLSKLNRDPAKIIYVSGHASQNSLQPENSVSLKPFKAEADDTTLVDLIPFLEYVARGNLANIRIVLASNERKDVAKEFLEHSNKGSKMVAGDILEEENLKC